MDTAFPLLTAIVVVPTVGALVVALLPKHRPDLVRLIGIMFALVTAALTVYLLIAFNRHDGGIQFVTQHVWIKEWGISWHLGVDGISLFLIVLTGVLFPLAFWGGAADATHDVKAYTGWMLLLEAGVLGTFMSPRPVPLLRLLRDRARADVLPHRRVGSRRARLRGVEVLPVHDGRLGVHARRPPRHGHPVPGQDRRPARSTSSQIANDQAIAASTTRWLFLAFAIAFAVKVPLVPVAHLAARRPHQGADGRLGRSWPA